MKTLRLYIRSLLREVYNLDRSDSKKFQTFEDQFGEDAPEFRRTIGLQTREEQIADRTYLQEYQSFLRKTQAGKKMIQSFMKGSITILHSIRYRGFTDRIGFGGSSEFFEASDWIKKYGKRGKDVLSTVPFTAAPSQSLQKSAIRSTNASAVSSSRGIMLKGYPVYVSQKDVMSQTLGALPDKIKQHQAQSGLAKRPNSAANDSDIPLPVYGLEQISSVGSAEEALVDNWTVIGTYIEYPTLQGRGALKETKSYVQDSLSIGLPCNIYWQGELVARIVNDKDYDEWLNTEKKGEYYV